MYVYILYTDSKNFGADLLTGRQTPYPLFRCLEASMLTWFARSYMNMGGRGCNIKKRPHPSLCDADHMLPIDIPLSVVLVIFFSIIFFIYRFDTTFHKKCVMCAISCKIHLSVELQCSTSSFTSAAINIWQCCFLVNCNTLQCTEQGLVVSIHWWLSQMFL